MFALVDLVFLLMTSRPAFIRLASHLLQDTHHLPFPSITSLRLATLAELFAASPKGKRKRSVSYVEGIPISSIILPSPYRAASNDEGRRIVGNRRMMDLDDAMSRLCVSGSTGSLSVSVSNESDEEEDEDDDDDLVIIC